MSNTMFQGGLCDGVVVEVIRVELELYYIVSAAGKRR